MGKIRKATQELQPKELEWPRLKWQSEMWFALIPFVLGFIVFLFPNLSGDEKYIQLRFIIGIPLLFSPLLVPLTIWGIRILNNAMLRIDEYPRIFALLVKVRSELRQLNQNFMDLVQSTSNQHRFEILKASVYEKQYFIVVKKTANPLLKTDDTLIVVDVADKKRMGNFQVTEERENEYYAQNIGNIDPVWSGYIRQRGEVTVNPNLTALYLP